MYRLGRSSEEQIYVFRQRFGDGHYYLACLTALLPTFTPDLLYRLWANFQYEFHAENLNVPWIAVSDLLLSGLCEEVGYELYEMKPTIRKRLLQHLKQDQRLGVQRFHEVADFLLMYSDTHFNKLEEDAHDLAEIQRWQALVYIKPDQALNEIAIKLSQLSTEFDQLNKNDKMEWIRMASAVKNIGIDVELTGFQNLLTYVDGMDAIARCNWREAYNNFSKVASSSQRTVQIAGVSLSIPTISGYLLDESLDTVGTHRDAFIGKQTLRDLDRISDLNRLKLELNELPAIDVGDYISGLDPEQRAITFRLLNKTQATDVFEYLPPDVRESLIGSLHNVQVRQIVESMRPEDRAELFDELPAGIVKRLIQQLSPEERQAIAAILGYAEGTVGWVMTTEYVRLREGLTVGEALSKIRLADRDKETIYYAYVTNNNRKLKQVVSLRQLLFSIPDARIEDIGSDRVIKAKTGMLREEVAQLMKRYDLLAVPVVDRDESLVGIITVDDVVDILEQEATEDIQKLKGQQGIKAFLQGLFN
jgi:CBS domain-containing protein